MSEINSDNFTKELRAMISTVNLLPSRIAGGVIKRSLNKFGRMYVKEVQQSIRGENADKNTLHRRTGALSRAFNHTTTNFSSGQSLLIWVDNSVKNYWRTQEEGAYIKAKPGKALAIPVGPALTPAGVPRYASPREVTGLVLIPRFKKAPVLGRFEGDKLVVYFVLKKSVKVPARLGLKDKWNKKLFDIIPILKEETKVALDGMIK